MGVPWGYLSMHCVGKRSVSVQGVGGQNVACTAVGIYGVSVHGVGDRDVENIISWMVYING
jgi:hypothetical protein